MQITGQNLCLVADALRDAKAEMNNQIATCPDVDRYVEELDDCEVWIMRYDKLLARVERALIKEGFTL
jgi:hypothetical protein